MATKSKSWLLAESIESSFHDYQCGYCNEKVSSRTLLRKHYVDEHRGPIYERIHICIKCGRPTYFDDSKKQHPAPLPGDEVLHLSPVVASLYREARVAISVGAHTAAVMVCRTILMHIAVEQGAPAKNDKGRSLPFIDYVSFLKEKGIVPVWAMSALSTVKDMGNVAVHDLVVINERDANIILKVVGVLLSVTYEAPAKMRQALSQLSSQAE